MLDKTRMNICLISLCAHDHTLIDNYGAQGGD